MDMNADAMYLMAVVESMKNEIEDLKTEKVNTLAKLEEAEKNVSMLKAENILLKMKTKDEKRRTQIEISKMRKARNRAYAYARRIENFSECKMSNIKNTTNAKTKKTLNDANDKLQNVTDQKNKEVQIWKQKYEKLDAIVGHFNEKSNRINQNILIHGKEYRPPLQLIVHKEIMLPMDLAMPIPPKEPPVMPSLQRQK